MRSTVGIDVHIKHARYGLIGLGFVALLAFTPAARGVTYLFPLLSFALALSLQRWLPKYYVSFVCWTFFLIAMLRRIIEYRTGADTGTPIMITPLLCSMAGLAAYRHRWSALLDRRMRPAQLVLGAILYALLIGLLQNPLYATVLDFVGWFSPICFGLYLFARRREIEEIFQSIQRSFLYGVAVMSVYGLYQYFILAPWDAAWMINSPGLNSIGTPEPRGVRLFSTMNTPQPFAACLVIGILVCLSAKTRLRSLIAPTALLCLLLTSSRSGWLGAAVGFIFLAVSFNAKQRVQLLIIAIGSVLFVALALQIPEISDAFSQRFQSFSNVGEDSSYQDRIASQRTAIEIFKTSPFGLGLGAVGAGGVGDGPSGGVAQPVAPTLGDNGIEEVVLTFGWFGTIVFVVGCGGVVALCFGQRTVPELMPMRAILVAMVVETPIMGVFPGVTGFLIWTALGLCAAYRFSPTVALLGSLIPQEPLGPSLLEETL